MTLRDLPTRTVGPATVSEIPTVSFGSPTGAQFSRPKSPIIVTSKMPEDDNDD